MKVKRKLKQGETFIWLVGLSASFALVSCSNAPTLERQLSVTPPSFTPARPSQPVIGWAQIARLGPRFVVFGEIHGTNESPLFFGRAAAALALQGKRVLVAVELSAEDNTRMQDAWNGPHSEFEDRLTASEWGGRGDGVTSAAMLEMLSQLHSIKDRGAALSLVAFNGFRDDAQRLRLDTPSSQGGHEAAQAENILDAANREYFDYVLVLVGETHARKHEVEYAGDRFQPMAMHLEHAGNVMSLVMAWSGGSAWNCILRANVRPVPQQPITTDMLDCGNHPLLGLAHHGNQPQIALGQLPGMEDGANFDGYYWLGAVSGSPPARP